MCDHNIRASPDEGLESTVRKSVLNRTNGRIHMLEVARQANCILVRGYTRSFYLKQLAIQAVLDVVCANKEFELEMDFHITVLFPPKEEPD
jgi:hypothetical protein